MVRSADLESGEWETAGPACSKSPEAMLPLHNDSIWGDTRKGDLRWDTVDTLPGTLEQIYLTPYPETESRANMFSKLPVGNIIQEELTIILLLNFKKYT